MPQPHALVRTIIQEFDVSVPVKMSREKLRISAKYPEIPVSHFRRNGILAVLRRSLIHRRFKGGSSRWILI